MEIYREFASGIYPRSVMLEMGGKNTTIASAQADLDEDAVGIVRSAFDLQGQECSSGSRVFADVSVKDELVTKIVALTQDLAVGDPTWHEVFMGPVIH